MMTWSIDIKSNNGCALQFNFFPVENLAILVTVLAPNLGSLIDHVLLVSHRCSLGHLHHTQADFIRQLGL